VELPASDGYSLTTTRDPAELICAWSYAGAVSPIRKTAQSLERCIHSALALTSSQLSVRQDCLKLKKF